MADLKPCPFCGQTPDANDPNTFRETNGTKWGAVICCCTGPEVRTRYHPWQYWKDEAIEAWNTRAASGDSVRDAASELLAACHKLLVFTEGEGDALDAVCSAREAIAKAKGEESCASTPQETD